MMYPITGAALLIAIAFCCALSYRAGLRQGTIFTALLWHGVFWGMAFFVTVAYMADRFANSTSADFGLKMWALTFIAQAIILTVFALPAWVLGRLLRKPPQQAATPPPFSPVWRPPLPPN